MGVVSVSRVSDPVWLAIFTDGEWSGFVDFRGRWGGRLLQTNYASSDRRGQLAMGRLRCGTWWGRRLQLLVSLVSVALGSGSRLVWFQKA